MTQFVKCFTSLLITGSALLLSAQCAVADTLIFSTSNVEPWGEFTSEYEPKGLLVDLNNALQAEIKRNTTDAIQFHNVIRPYPRVINDIKTGAADFAVLFNSPESNNFGDSLGEVSRFQVLVTGRSDAPVFHSLEGLQGKTIGYVRGSKYGDAFDNNQELMKVSLDSMDKGLDMLLKGRVDVLVCLDQTLLHALKKKGIAAGRTKTLFVLGEARTDLFISKRSMMQLYIDEVRSALQTLHKNGTIQAIFDLNRPE